MRPQTDRYILAYTIMNNKLIREEARRKELTRAAYAADWLKYYGPPDCQEAVEDYERYVEELKHIREKAQRKELKLNLAKRIDR